MLVFTSCVNNYLPKARALAYSVKAQHPDWEFCLLLGEDPPQGVSAASEPFDRIIRYEDLGVPNYKGWHFQHRLVEICTAIKGQALNYFLETEGQEKVIYLDPDILVLAPLSPLAVMLDEYDILLTPHQLAPQNDARAIEDNEICSLRHGVFNLGFVACAKREQGIEFSRFWRDRLADWCFDDKGNGLFTDQKWCDLAPAYFPSLGIVRDPGCNAASWNLTDRIITQNTAGEFLANGLPLRFYHFTGYDSGMGKVMSSIYGANMPAVAELWQIYENKLKTYGQEQLGKMPWSGATYSNGKTVTDQARLHYRQTPALQTLFPDPFLTDSRGTKGFAGYWRDYQIKEGNLFYVWARKPFRLLKLARLYLGRNGGIKAAPRLLARIGDIWRQEGTAGVLAKIKHFKQKMGVGEPQLNLGQILKPPSQWAAILPNIFHSQNGVLVLDHMYGGGANDYREKRIADFLARRLPVLLLTWDFFGHKLKCAFRLPDGAAISVDARDLQEVAKQDGLRFGHILINELVLWSGAKYRQDHYAALPHLFEQIMHIKKRDKALLEIAIHDYYPLCPNYNLLEAGKSWCRVSNDMQRCSRCLAQSPFNVPKGFEPALWREDWKTALANADRISTFSQASADILKLGFGPGLENIHIGPHTPLDALPEVKLETGPMRVAVVGHIAYHKGSEIVKELARLLNPEESVVVIGELENSADMPSNIKVTGSYQRRDLPALIEREHVTIALVPSICPETFCYVVQECMQMKLPLVVFPLGAQAERVREYPDGLVAEAISASAALTALRRLAARNQS